MIPAPNKLFQYTRVLRPDDVPVPHARTIDVAILDMNYEFLNLGHDSLVYSVHAIARDLAPVPMARMAVA